MYGANQPAGQSAEKILWSKYLAHPGSRSIIESMQAASNQSIFTALFAALGHLLHAPLLNLGRAPSNRAC